MLSRNLTRPSPSQPQRYYLDGGRASPSLLSNGASIPTGGSPCGGGDSPGGGHHPPYPQSSASLPRGGLGGSLGCGGSTPPAVEGHHMPQRVLQFRNLVEATRTASYATSPGALSSLPTPPPPREPQAPAPPKLGRSRRGSTRVRASAAPLSPGVRNRMQVGCSAGGGDGGGSRALDSSEHGAAAVLNLLQFRPASPALLNHGSASPTGGDSMHGSTSGLCGSGMSLMDRCLSVSLGSSWMHDGGGGGGGANTRNASLSAAAASLASSGASASGTQQQQRASTTRRTFGSPLTLTQMMSTRHKSSSSSNSFNGDLGLLLAASGSSIGSPCELLGAGSCATASTPSTGAASASFGCGLRPRPQNLTEFPASELHMHVLSRALSALCPPGRPWCRDQLVRTREAALASAAALAATCADGDVFLAERHLQQCVEHVRRALPSGGGSPAPRDGVAEASLYPDVSAVCEAAGKPGNEDRVFVVPDVLAYLCPEKGSGDGDGDADAPCVMVGVLDGHGGVDTAQYCAAVLPHLVVGSPRFPDDVAGALRDGFRAMQRDLVARYARTHSQSGTTATVAVLHRQRLYVANVGDSAAVLASGGGAGAGSALALTCEHHVSSAEEQRALRERGGEIYEVRGVLRVEGRCRVSRNLGLVEVACLGHEPDVSVHDLRGSDAHTLVLASDGLWDCVTADQVCRLAAEDIVSSEASRRSSVNSWGTLTAKLDIPMASSVNSPALWRSVSTTFSDASSLRGGGGGGTVKAAPHGGLARKLVREAVNRDTRDNCSVVTVRLGC